MQLLHRHNYYLISNVLVEHSNYVRDMSLSSKLQNCSYLNGRKYSNVTLRKRPLSPNVRCKIYTGKVKFKCLKVRLELWNRYFNASIQK